MGHLRGRLIVFDLDGTLIDSRRDLAESANQLIVELGGRPLPEEAIGRMVGDGAAVLVSRALAAAGLEATPGALARFLEIYDTRLLDHTRPYAGIAEAVEELTRHGSVAVLTNKPLRASERILQGLGLRGLFCEVIGGDGPHPRKPNPAGLIALMASEQSSPDATVMVGDSLIDFQTATAAGVRVCLARYGFGYDTFPLERLDGSEVLVDRPADMAAAVAALLAERGYQ